eukprot:2658476-Heterocapsa_arctica.AAC.1
MAVGHRERSQRANTRQLGVGGQHATKIASRTSGQTREGTDSDDHDPLDSCGSKCCCASEVIARALPDSPETTQNKKKSRRQKTNKKN